MSPQPEERPLGGLFGEAELYLRSLRDDLVSLEEAGCYPATLVEELREVLEEIETCLRAAPDR